MQLVNGHEGGKESRAMVLDPIILPLSYLSVLHLTGREVGNLKRSDGGNYDFVYKHVEVITIYVVKD